MTKAVLIGDTVCWVRWRFVKDARALFLLQLPSEASFVEFVLSPSEILLKANISLSTNDNQCNLCNYTSDEVYDFMSRELWNRLQLGHSSAVSRTLPLYDFMCNLDYWTWLSRGSSKLECWKEGGIASIYPKTLTGIQTAASCFSVAICFVLPLILMFSIQRGIFKDEDDDECFGLNVYPFPLGISYFIFVWRPNYKPIRYLVYMARFIGVEMFYGIFSFVQERGCKLFFYMFCY